MKIYILLLLCLVSSISFAQNNYIVKTEDGRRVLLKADFTWEYIDAESTSIPNIEKPNKAASCQLTKDFEEPKLNKKIQAQLKKGRATISHVKKKVAKDNDCIVDDVLLLSVTEQKAKAVYHFCAKGKKVIYKRIGNTIIKKENTLLNF